MNGVAPRLCKKVPENTAKGTERGCKTSTLGEDVIGVLEYGPGHFDVNRIIRPGLSCETISQAPMLNPIFLKIY